MVCMCLQFWEIPVSLCCLSVAWSPHLQKKQLFPCQKQFEKLYAKSSLARGSAENIHEDESVDASSVIFVHPELSCRWKISWITNLLKIIFIIICSLLYLHIKHLFDFHQIASSFRSMTPKHAMFPAVMINIFCSFVGNILGFLGCTMSSQKPAFALPLVFATPMSCLLVLLDDWIDTPWKGFIGCKSEEYTKLHWYVIAAAVCSVLAQVLSTAVFIFRTQTLIMQKTSQVTTIVLYYT
jgi:hypothetical protein